MLKCAQGARCSQRSLHVKGAERAAWGRGRSWNGMQARQKLSQPSVVLQQSKTAWSSPSAALSPWTQAVQEESEFSEAALWSWDWPWWSWPQPQASGQQILPWRRGCQCTSLSILPLGAFIHEGSEAVHQSLSHERSRWAPSAPTFYKGSKRAVRKTGIKPSLIDDTSTIGDTERNDGCWEEGIREESVN